MDAHAALHRLIGRWQKAWARAPEPDGELRAGGSQLRQAHLARLRRRGIPTWNEQPEHCDACGRELLIGERASLFVRGAELLLACPLCAARLQDEGALPVPTSARSDGGEQLEIAS